MSRRRTDKSAAQPPGNPAPLPLAGREAELNALRNAGESEGKFIVLEGEAGIGKTRLAEEFLDYIRGTPTVIFFDDLHWADEASLDLLTYIVRRLKGRALCLLGTWRGEGLAADHHLRQLLAEAERAGIALHLSLARLSEATVAELVQSALGTNQNGQLAERLYRETEGLPLFVVEYLANLNQAAPGSEWSLPAGVRGLLQSRLNQVDEAGKQLLGAAAVIGRSFDFDTLQSASGRSDEETIAGLEALIRLGLIHELGNDEGGPHYDFNHDKLRALVYDETSLARRRLLHRRAAQTLAAQARGRGAIVLGARASQLERSLALAVSMGGVAAQTAALNNLALAYRTNDQVTDAIAFAEHALNLCVALGDHHRQAALHNNLLEVDGVVAF